MTLKHITLRFYLVLIAWFVDGIMTPDRVLGATVVSGIISGIWTTNGSPYVLTADCSVLADQSLAIDPGVTVIIEPDVGVDVFGQITAVGTPRLPITIRGASSGVPRKIGGGATVNGSFGGFSGRPIPRFSRDQRASRKNRCLAAVSR